MVTHNKTWRFSKRINNDNYNVWRKNSSQFGSYGMNGAKLNASIVVPHARAIKCTD